MSSQITDIINQKDPIAYRIPIGLDSKTVDFLLQDYADLITTSYIPWFAKRFYKMERELIQRLASEARVDGRNPGCLFRHLIDKHSQNNH